MAPGAHRMEWRPRHQHPVTLIGALSLTVAVAGASWVGCASLRDPFRITAQRVTASPAGPRARIQVDVTLTPHARARFLSLDGQLGVRGRDVAFKVDGLERGDLLIPGEPHTLSVTAVADAAQKHDSCAIATVDAAAATYSIRLALVLVACDAGVYW